MTPAFQKRMLAAWLVSLLTLLAAGAAAAPTEGADTSGQQGGRGRLGKRGVMVRRRPHPGYNQETIQCSPL